MTERAKDKSFVLSFKFLGKTKTSKLSSTFCGIYFQKQSPGGHL